MKSVTSVCFGVLLNVHAVGKRLGCRRCAPFAHQILNGLYYFVLLGLITTYLSHVLSDRSTRCRSYTRLLNDIPNQSLVSKVVHLRSLQTGLAIQMWISVS